MSSRVLVLRPTRRGEHYPVTLPALSMATPDSEKGPGLSDVPLLLFVRGIFVLLLVVALAAGLHAYIGSRLISPSGLPVALQGAAWVALWAAFATMPLGFMAGRLLPRPLSGFITWVGFLWMGFFAVLLPTTLTTDLVFWSMKRAGVVLNEPERLQAIAIAAIALPSLLWAFLVARSPRVKRVKVSVPGLPEGLVGFKIAQITDVHIGETLRKKFLERVVAQVNSIEADFIAVTGDLIDGTVAKLRDEMEPLTQLKATHGAYYVTGNHEYYHGGPAWSAHAARLGLNVLHNAHKTVEHGGARLAIGGVPDLEGGRFHDSHRPDVGKAFEGAPVDAVRILLAHQPRVARLAQGHNVSLQLSGHTHGGQMFPFMFFVKLQQPVIAGLKEIWGTLVYTSNGTGYWGPPFRLGPQGEVTELTLQRG